MQLELSEQAGQELQEGILNLVSGFLESYTRPQPRILGLMTPKQIEDELGIKYKTLQRWESAGLKRYQPPLEDARKVFYKVSDILIFLGVEDG